MRIAFFEDSAAAGFAPIALMRPVFELICGDFSVRERVVRTLDVTDWGAVVRPFLAETYREAQPEAHVNDFIWLAHEPTLLLNGRFLPTYEQLVQLATVEENVVGLVGNTIAFLKIEGAEASLLTESEFDDPLAKIAATREPVEAAGIIVERPWDLIDNNPHILIEDFRQRVAGAPVATQSVERAISEGFVIQGRPDDVFIDETAEVDPFVVLDARDGPISIAAGAKVQAFTRIEGPCHISTGSQLFRANVKGGTTIGPTCRVGGEIEAAIMHGFANKYHDGFLGHSYICPWVNLGALTTNSDLKNDYSTVRVPLTGQSIDSGSNKVGCFIGDHTKTALCSQFNTGSSIGVMTMILPGGELLPKHVPSFSRVWHGEIDDNLDLEAGIETARIAMDRRNCDLTPAQERLLKTLHSMTQAEREQAIERMQTRRSRQPAVR